MTIDEFRARVEEALDELEDDALRASVEAALDTLEDCDDEL